MTGASKLAPASRLVALFTVTGVPSPDASVHATTTVSPHASTAGAPASSARRATVTVRPGPSGMAAGSTVFTGAPDHWPQAAHSTRKGAATHPAYVRRGIALREAGTA